MEALHEAGNGSRVRSDGRIAMKLEHCDGTHRNDDEVIKGTATLSKYILNP